MNYVYIGTNSPIRLIAEVTVLKTTEQLIDVRIDKILISSFNVLQGDEMSIFSSQLKKSKHDVIKCIF